MVKLIKENWNNQFIFNNRYLNNIIFYNDEGVFTETKCGWFGNGNNYYKEFEVGDIKIRNVSILNKMNKKENFVIPLKNYLNEKCYNLYLYIDDNNIKIINHTIENKNMTDTLIYTYDVFSISIFNEIVEIKTFIKSEKTNFGNIVEQMQNELKALNIDIDEYILTKLMKQYDLVKK